MARTASLEVGTELPSQSFEINRVDMVRYAGASGDFNTIHWNETFAKSVGLPNVIAHGMLTMAIAARVVTDWIGDPGAVLEYGVRFTRPVVVSEDAATSLDVAGKVRSVDEENSSAVLDLIASVNGETVLAKARVTVRLPSS
ncbi:MaoC family dehydratase [soil metagenome]|jgi:acyl dehydratase